MLQGTYNEHLSCQTNIEHFMEVALDSVSRLLGFCSNRNVYCCIYISSSSVSVCPPGAGRRRLVVTAVKWTLQLGPSVRTPPSTSHGSGVPAAAGTGRGHWIRATGPTAQEDSRLAQPTIKLLMNLKRGKAPKIEFSDKNNKQESRVFLACEGRE